MWIRREVFVLVIAGAALSFAACSDDDTSPAMASGGGGSGQAPVITKISWTHDPGCAPGVSTPVTVQVDVNDPDTDISQLTYSGSVASCGAITSDTTRITCPEIAAYAGAVTVTDPEGNSDSAMFSFGPCQDGQSP